MSLIYISDAGVGRNAARSARVALLCASPRQRRRIATATGGSLATVNLPATVSGNTFNADNGMTGFNGTTLSYDANGNLIADGTNTYTWDARNHLSAISGGSTARFAHNGQSRYKSVIRS